MPSADRLLHVLMKPWINNKKYHDNPLVHRTIALTLGIQQIGEFEVEKVRYLKFVFKQSLLKKQVELISSNLSVIKPQNTFLIRNILNGDNSCSTRHITKYNCSCIETMNFFQITTHFLVESVANVLCFMQLMSMTRIRDESGGND